MGLSLNAPEIVTALFNRTLPGAVGLNAISISQLPPAGTPTAQVVKTLTKGGLTRMLVIGIANFSDLLFRVMVCEGLWRVTICSPKKIGSLGLTSSFGKVLADAGPAAVVSTNSNEKTRPTIDRANNLRRISRFPPQATPDLSRPLPPIRAFS